MAYAVITRDKPGSAELRQARRAEHLAYLDANKNLLLAAGAQVEDDGSGGSGSILLVDTDDRAEAEKLVAGDPFTKAGLFDSVTVVRWRKVFFDKQRLV